MPAKPDIRLFNAQRFSGRDFDLLAHDIHSGDQLGDRMLDLKSRVHLDKEKLAILVKKFKSAGASITYFAAGVGASFVHIVSHVIRNSGRRCFFQNLLMTPLHRTVSVS